MKKFLRNNPQTPYIISVPHAGRFYPKLFLENKSIDLTILKKMEDYKCDLIVKKIDRNLADVIIAKCSRVVVDLNRARNSIDNKMFEKNLNIIPSCDLMLIKAGLGLFPSKCYDSKIFNKRLSAEYKTKMIRKFYDPYHKLLNKTIKSHLVKFHYSVLIDIHSTPSFSQNQEYKLKDIIISDNFGKSCPANFRYFIQNFFEKNNLSVSINTPYSGGFITRRYGEKNKNISAIQIEINKKLYMDEKTYIINDNISELQIIFKNLMNELSQINKIAAE